MGQQRPLADNAETDRECTMPELPVDASKFAGMSEEQARTFPRRTVVGEELTRRASRRDAADDLDRRHVHGARRAVAGAAAAPARASAEGAVPQFAARRDRSASAPARPGHRRRRRRDPVPQLRHGAVRHRRHRDAAGSRSSSTTTGCTASARPIPSGSMARRSSPSTTSRPASRRCIAATTWA